MVRLHQVQVWFGGHQPAASEHRRRTDDALRYWHFAYESARIHRKLFARGAIASKLKNNNGGNTC